jgi:5-methyltetrahydrofolate--homocysteine methyltransferase
MEQYKDKEIQESLIGGNEVGVRELVTKLLQQGVAPSSIISEGLIAGMVEVGKRFRDGDMFIPEVMLCARIMSSNMATLEPLLVGTQLPTAGKVVIGTVEGDVHNIGKDLVSMMLRSAGFAIVDLGVQVPSERFVQAVAEHKPEALGMSALLTTTMPKMKEVIELLQKRGLRDRVQVIVGGAPVTQEYADEIGANGYAPDAGSAVDKVKELIGV